MASLSTRSCIRRHARAAQLDDDLCGRRERLKRLIGLAPATFGSPLAHKGRGFLGAIFKGDREIGPDLLEAGEFDPRLARAGQPLPGHDRNRPARRAAVLRSAATTRHTLCFLRHAELSRDTAACRRARHRRHGALGRMQPEHAKVRHRFLTRSGADAQAAPRPNRDSPRDDVLSIPFWPVAGKNHTTIISEPDDTLVDLGQRALQVDSQEKFAAWEADARRRTANAVPAEKWQQFVIRAVDERGRSDHRLSRRPVSDERKRGNTDRIRSRRARLPRGPQPALFPRQSERTATGQGEGGRGPIWARIIACPDRYWSAITA